MNVVSVKTKQKTYEVMLGFDILSQLKEVVDVNRPLLVITDDYVKKLHYDKLLKYLPPHHDVCSLPNPPETIKNLGGYNQILEFAYLKQYPRNLQIIAFGGGAIGDLAGYFAATYKRGISFIQVPTTILAHDSSVGGKVAINYKDIKNMIGAFYQPECVIYDLTFLNSLSELELRSGFGEIVKHSMLSKVSFLKRIMDRILTIDHLIHKQEELLALLTACIEVKKTYVERDVFDQAVRQYLNFGHTLAHGIEKRYRVSHGEAVAYGICFDLFLSEQTDINSLDLYAYFKMLGFFKDIDTLDLEDLYNIMKHDKKNTNELLTFIGLETPGQPYKIQLNKADYFDKMNEFIQLTKQVVI